MSIGLETLQELGLTRNDPVKPRNQLGQEEFLKLMTTQLSNQDPFKPMESGEFLGQIAQFSTVSGIKDLQDSFGQFANSVSSDQALQAANLVGRSVLASGHQGVLAAGGELSGAVDVPGPASSVVVDILDSNGERIKQIDLGSRTAGPVEFSWDGVTSDGSYADPGTYELHVNAVVDGTGVALTPLIRSRVESVTLDRNGSGLVINAAGQGAINFSDIHQIL